MRASKALFGQTGGNGAIDRAIRREETAGLRYAFYGRVVVLALLAVWVATSIPLERSGFYLAAMGTFLVLGAAPFLLRRLGLRGWLPVAAFLTLDVLLLCYLLIVPPPIFAEGWTAQLNLRVPNFLYLGLFLIGISLSYSPHLVIWTGAVAIAGWSAGILWVASMPESITLSSRDLLDRGVGEGTGFDLLLHPSFVSLTRWYNQVVFLVLVTLILAVVVWRSRLLVRRQVTAEAARSSLSRYFSPNIVDEITRSGASLDASEEQRVAILFVDIVGFTKLSETMSPTETIDFLRDFHARLGKVVFDHDGTIDKYMGDGIMVNFGTPRPRPDDTRRALTCALAMLAEIDTWNGEREAAGKPPVAIGIGLHYGPVVVGNIGDTRRLEFAVLGDTVNVAARLEAMTRTERCALIASDDLVASLAEEERPRLCDGMTPLHGQAVRGRDAPIDLWLYRKAGGAAA